MISFTKSVTHEKHWQSKLHQQVLINNYIETIHNWQKKWQVNIELDLILHLLTSTLHASSYITLHTSSPLPLQP